MKTLFKEDRTEAETELEAQRAFVIGLTMGCPFDQSNPPECPLQDLRELSVRQRLDWANGLNMAELQRVRSDHDACLSRKEQQVAPRS